MYQHFDLAVGAAAICYSLGGPAAGGSGGDEAPLLLLQQPLQLAARISCNRLGLDSSSHSNIVRLGLDGIGGALHSSQVSRAYRVERGRGRARLWPGGGGGGQVSGDVHVWGGAHGLSSWTACLPKPCHTATGRRSRMLYRRLVTDRRSQPWPASWRGSRRRQTPSAPPWPGRPPGRLPRQRPPRRRLPPRRRPRACRRRRHRGGCTRTAPRAGSSPARMPAAAAAAGAANLQPPRLPLRRQPV